MIADFKKYKKYKDYVNFTEIECYLSLIITVIAIILLIKIDFQKNFLSYQECIKQIVLSIAAGILAMIGALITGMALTVSLLDRKFMSKLKDSERIKGILVSFQFLLFNLGIATVWMYGLYFFLNVANLNIPVGCFYLITVLTIYYILFIIFYTIALFSNNIKLFFIKNTIEKIEENKKTMYEQANEIRLDVLIRKEYGNNCNEFIDDLMEITDKMQINDKEKIMKYFTHYYNIK